MRDKSVHTENKKLSAAQKSFILLFGAVEIARFKQSRVFLCFSNSLSVASKCCVRRKEKNQFQLLGFSLFLSGS